MVIQQMYLLKMVDLVEVLKQVHHSLMIQLVKQLVQHKVLLEV